MAGEWLQIDCNISTKPEVLELCDVCGLEPDVVIGRLVQLWLWAALNAEDGTAKMTPPRLCRTFGGDVDFWNAVKEVGWLEIDAERRTVTVPGWEERFSGTAKARAMKAKRAATYESTHPGRKSSGAQAPEPPAHKRGNTRRSCAAEERRGEEKREEYPPPPPRESFEEIRAAWNAGPGKPWKPHTPPKGREGVLADAEWMAAALEAIPRLAACKYFATPPTLAQFMGDGFVQNVLGGVYDAPKNTYTGRTGARGAHDDAAPLRQFSGEFEERKRLTLAKLAAADAAG